MLPSRSLLFTLYRYPSSLANQTQKVSIIFKSNYTRIISNSCFSQRTHEVCAGCSAYKNVRLLSSSVTSPENSNQKELDAESFQRLRDNGFSEDACREILVKLSPLRLDNDKFSSTMASWGACQFGHDRLIYLLTENPDLLLVDNHLIMSSFTFLSSQFSHNYVYKILLNCPQVMFEKHSEVSSKLDFLNKKLGIPNSEIVISSSLGHPLRHLRTRHEFLKRCGVYKMVAGAASKTNPSLSDMFDTSDEEFARKVARLSTLEYEVFKNLFSFEEEEEDDGESSDSDSD